MSSTPAAPESGAGETLPLMSELITAPSFRVGMRGYDPREVDRWVKYMETQVSAAKNAHRELAADVRSLADQLDRAHEELAVLRRRPSIDDTIAFRHLGPRVEQILADAHAEADEILRSARASADELRVRTEEHLRTTREQHTRADEESEAHRKWLQEEEQRWSRLLQTRKSAAERADEYRRRVRRDAEDLLEAATTQHERIVASAIERSEQMLAQATAETTAQREGAQRAIAADRQAASEARAEAERERAEAARERSEAQRERLAVTVERERSGEPQRFEPAAAEYERDEAAAAAQTTGPAATGAPGRHRRETAAATEEAVGSAELAAPAVGTAAVDASDDTAAPEPARGVAKVVYVVNPGEPEAEGESAPEKPAEARRSTVDAR
jgi:cell division septum initiation protein DivIVA